MALTRTPLSGGVAVADTEILLTSIANVALSSQIVIDQEKMRVLSVGASATVPVGVLRGIGGSAVVAHPTGALATVGAPGDFSPPTRVGATSKNEIVSYSATGAIALPRAGTNRIVFLNGAVALTMSVAAPSKENDGDMLIIIALGKAAHVVNVAGGGLGAGGTSVDGFTFAATGQNSLVLIAANEVWAPFGSVLAGTLTSATVTAG